MSTKAHTSFPEDVSRCTEQCLLKEGFISTQWLFPCDSLVAYIKHCDDITAFYLMYQDNRSTGGNVKVTLWLAPIQLPDARIEVLGIGIKIILFEDFNVNDSIICGVTNKGVALVDKLKRFTGIVNDELSNPFYENRRMIIFRKALQIESIARSQSSIMKKLDEILDRFFNGDIDYEKVRNLCADLIYEDSSFECSDLRKISISQKSRLLAEMVVARRLVLLSTRC